MTTLHLVAAEARDIVSQFPEFNLTNESLAEFRDLVANVYAMPTSVEPKAREVRWVRGHMGAPDVRVLIYRSDDMQPLLPAILYLHGGGYVAGSPDLLDAANQTLANDHKVLVLAVQYRLAPETAFPGPIEDCYAALDFMCREASTLGIDPSRIVVFGHSAGGGLAAALALLVRDRGEHTLKAQVLVYPMLDDRTGTPEALFDNPITGQFMWTRAANSFGWQALRGANPIALEELGYCVPARAENVGDLPPAFIGVGSLDLFLDEDLQYALRLCRAGVPTEVHVYDGGVHGFDNIPGSLCNQFSRDLTAAIARHLRG